MGISKINEHVFVTMRNVIESKESIPALLIRKDNDALGIKNGKKLMNCNYMPTSGDRKQRSS